MATTDTSVPQVIVNKLTKAQYDAATKSPTEFYAVTDEDIYSDFTGATSSTAGAHGLVPAPAAGDEGKFLQGDGTWATVSAGATVTTFYFNGTTSIYKDSAMTTAANKQDILTAIESGQVIIKYPSSGSLIYDKFIQVTSYSTADNVLKFQGTACSDGTNRDEAFARFEQGSTDTTWNFYKIPIQRKLTAGTNVTISNNTISATDTTYSDFVGSTGVADGDAGLVPKPLIADTSKFLKGDGTWDTPADTTYTAGTNVQISAQNVISATDTTYSAFDGATSSVAGSAGLVPAPSAGDQDKVLHGDGTWKDTTAKLVEMSYGEANAWAKFIAAYNAGSIVYCRASSNANPGTGSQTRKAFMAYVNNATSPTSVEFQYVRSQSSKTDSQQCDQVFVYTLTNASGGTWSVASRNMAPKINVDGPITKTFTSGANATVTIGANAMTGATSGTAGAAGVVPAPAAGDEGKFLAGDGTWKTAGGGGGNTATYIATDLLQMVYTTAMQNAQMKGIGSILNNLMFPNQGFVFLKEDGSEVVPADEICEKFGQGYDIKLKCMFQQYGGMNVPPGFEKINGSIIAADPYSITNFPMTMSFMHDNATNVGSGGTFVVKTQQSAQGSDSKKYATFTKL